MRDAVSIAKHVADSFEDSSDLASQLSYKLEFRFSFLITGSSDPALLSNSYGLFNLGTSERIAEFTDWRDLFLEE